MNRARQAIVLGVLVVFATCAVGATASQVQTAAGPAYKKVGSWGKAGSAKGQFLNVPGLATDKTGKVYTLDADNNRVQVFTAKGAWIRMWGSKGDGSGQFSNAQDLALDSQGNVWVADDGNVRLQQFSGGGTFLTEIPTTVGADGVGVDPEGNVYYSYGNDNVHAVQRFDKTETGWEAGKTFGGFQSPGDVAVSADGSIYVSDHRGDPPNVKRFDSTGKLLKTIKLQMPGTAGAGALFGIGVDPDCNVWATNAAQRNVAKYSPAGKLLGTVTSGDLIGVDVAVGPTGDLYVFDSGSRSIIHLAEDRSKPATATVVGLPLVSKTAKGYVARVKYALSAVACPAKVAATATLSGKGIAGKASVTLPVGKTTVIEIPLAKATAGSRTTATFKIVLKTNGRPTTQTRTLPVSVP